MDEMSPAEIWALSEWLAIRALACKLHKAPVNVVTEAIRAFLDAQA